MRIFLIFVILFSFEVKSQKVPLVIEHSKRIENIVISAPHGGYEIFTTKIAKDIAQNLHCGCVLARGYRSPKNKRWINVNRPSECLYTKNKKSAEKITDKASKVYHKYLKAVHNAAVDGVFLFVELHGNNRKLYGTQEALMVIEIATTNIDKLGLEKFIEIYKSVIAETKPPLYIPVYIDKLHRQYQYKNKNVPFQWSAHKTKEYGILSLSHIYGLHFELPLKIRKDKNLRRIYTEILSKVIGKWWQVFNEKKVF